MSAAKRRFPQARGSEGGKARRRRQVRPSQVDQLPTEFPVSQQAGWWIRPGSGYDRVVIECCCVANST